LISISKSGFLAPNLDLFLYKERCINMNLKFLEVERDRLLSFILKIIELGILR